MELVEDTLPVELASFLERPLFCFLATRAPDGPRVSPLWFHWEDGAIWVIVDTETKSYPDRVRGHPETALAIVDYDPGTGLVQHVGMRGEATLVPFDETLARRLLRRYLGSDESSWDPSFAGPWDDRWRLLRFEPATVVARDQSYDVAGEPADGR